MQIKQTACWEKLALGTNIERIGNSPSARLHLLSKVEGNQLKYYIAGVFDAQVIYREDTALLK
jgi:hypothetical protein